jgi:uncharacterized protein YjiS (DUF1127 family)
MSTLFKCPPDALVKHDDLKLPGANKITTSVGGAGQKLEQKCNSLASRNAPSVLLRDDHIVLLAIDALLALHASFKKWRKYRRTLALADLDERQLRDIGFTRDEALSEAPFKLLGHQRSCRALAELDETQLSNLSERGLQVRREARRTMHHPR